MKHAFIRATQSSYGKDLQLESLNTSILWQGKGGMKWSEVLCKIKHLLKFIDPPNFIILHCGGNDICDCKSLQLINNIISTLKTMFELLPNTKIIWSQILPRLKWRYEKNHVAVDKIRKRVNSKIATFLLKNGGYYIRYPEITELNTGLFQPDNVHLSKLGNDIFLYRIQQALQRFLLYNVNLSPPLFESGPWL